MLLIEWKKITEKDNFKCETCTEIKKWTKYRKWGKCANLLLELLFFDLTGPLDTIVTFIQAWLWSIT